MNTDRITRINGDAQEVVYSDGTKLLVGATSAGQSGDTFHTIDELYRHRALLTAALFNSWNMIADETGTNYNPVHKSRLHSDGTAIEGFFIVMAELPTGQFSYHYPLTDWDLFDIPELARALPWDGHTSADVLDRIERYLRGA